jgi:hypothetical protein
VRPDFDWDRPAIGRQNGISIVEAVELGIICPGFSPLEEFSNASDFSIYCRTNADSDDCYWRLGTGSKQSHPKGMLQFTNMRHRL